MRIKRDKTNWNASSIIKRDVRHTHDEPRVSLRGKKDTKRWCRGKIGVEHVWERYARFHRMYIYMPDVSIAKKKPGVNNLKTRAYLLGSK